MSVGDQCFFFGGMGYGWCGLVEPVVLNVLSPKLDGVNLMQDVGVFFTKNRGGKPSKLSHFDRVFHLCLVQHPYV